MGQHKLGDRAELPRDTVGRIERSEQEARLRTLRKISAALQVPLRSLLDGLLD
jgi:transcriptional regulator with XRE-family HTH domain